MSGPLAAAASQAGVAGGPGVFQSPAHCALFSCSYIFQGCAALCAAGALGPEPAVRMCRAVPLFTGAGRILLESMAACSLCSPPDRAESAVQQLLAINGCMNSFLVLLDDGRPVRDAGALFQPAPVLRWLEAVADALLAEHPLLPGASPQPCCS